MKTTNAPDMPSSDRPCEPEQGFPRILPRAYTIAYHTTRSAAIAEDAVQTALLEWVRAGRSGLFRREDLYATVSGFDVV